jgi:hypothetical protein
VREKEREKERERERERERESETDRETDREREYIQLLMNLNPAKPLVMQFENTMNNLNIKIKS